MKIFQKKMKMKKINKFIHEAIKSAEPYGGEMGTRSPDLMRWIASHKVELVPDKNGNDDKLFKASNIKRADMKRHGRKSEKETGAVSESFVSKSYDYTSSAPNKKFDEEEYNDTHEEALEELEKLKGLIHQHKKHVMMHKKSGNNIEAWMSNRHTVDMERIRRDLNDYRTNIAGVVETAKPYEAKKKGK